VSITGPDSEDLYSEGPYRTNEVTRLAEPASEGSFRFRLYRIGKYRVALTNPSSSSPRTVTFAWLLGKDADDAFTSRGLPPKGAAGGAGGGGGRNASDTVLDIAARVSRVHKSLDEVVALQQFVDVRFARSMAAAALTSGRVQWWTIAECAIVVLAAVLQTLVIQRFDVRAPVFNAGARLGAGAGASRMHHGGPVHRSGAHHHHKTQSGHHAV
jgi:hypothetical protein